MLLAVCLLVFINNSCSSNEVLRGYKTKNVVVIVVDGPRYSETWGDTSHQYIPHQFQMLSNAVFFDNFSNSGDTRTAPGHTSICTGVNEPINNSGLELPSYPSIFQYWIKKYKKSTTDAWVIASKDKLEVLGDCELSEWKGQYQPSTDCGNNGLGSGYRPDDLTTSAALYHLKMHHPQMVLINFRNPDYAGHTGDWNAYLAGIKSTDSLVNVLVEFLNDDPVYKERTAIFITNDHGRHLDGVADGFKSHGDGCAGCRKISLLAMGPDFKAGTVVSSVHDQRDLAATIAQIMNVSIPTSDGKAISELVGN